MKFFYEFVETIMTKKKQNKRSIAVIGLKGLPAFGGAATVGQNIINQLHQQYKFTVFSVETHAEPDFKLGDVEQVIFRKFPLKKLNILFYYIKSCLYVLFSCKFDAVHLHHTDGAFILPFLRLRYKVILTSHAQPQRLLKWSGIVRFFFSFNEYLAIKSASVFTAVSKPLQQIYQEKYKRDVIYIPNGVDLNIVEDVKDINVTEPYLMFAAGRIIPSKGLHLLLQALKNIQFKGVIKIVGNLDHLPAYRKSIVQQAEGLNVEFVGLIKDKAELLSLVKNAQLFIFPSLIEAMSIMLLEVALIKTPVLCSDIVANKAVFNENEVLYFNSNNQEDLAAKLQYALKNLSSLKERARCAFTKLEKEYKWDQIAHTYKHIYDEILN
ncbi:glycosyltransferase family 4 protein [Labilibacter sediminis]|nr:glycosyltransferase family 4 protein [Labilibacter sediminis]